MTVIQVEATLDTICPFCYLGKKNLEKAVEEHGQVHPEDEVEVLWKPYYLHPTMLKSAYTKTEVYEQKFGTARLAAFLARVHQAGAEHDIVFDLEAGKTGSSRDSHKLLVLARQHSYEAQSRAIDLLFEGTLQQGRDISDVDFLVETARRVGLEDETAVRRFLADESVGEALDRQVRTVKTERVIAAVPAYKVQGRYLIGGYQQPAVFLGVFEKVKAAAAAASPGAAPAQTSAGDVEMKDPDDRANGLGRGNGLNGLKDLRNGNAAVAPVGAGCE